MTKRTSIIPSAILACFVALSTSGQINRPHPPEPAPLSDLFYVEYYEPDGSLSLLIPLDTDAWSPSLALRVNWTFWTYENIGWAASFGVEFWRIRDSAFPLDPGFTSVSVDGGANVYPLGLAFRYSIPYAAGWRANISAGLEYLFIVPTAVVHFRYDDHWGRPQDDQSSVSFDDRFAIACHVDGGYSWDENLNFHFGLGARIDLHPGGSNWLGEDMGNDFSALTLNTGISWRF